MRRRLAVAFGAAALSLGCNLAPRYVRPEAPVPKTLPKGEATARASNGPLPSVRYQDIFRDPKLQSIIASALRNSRDLRIATANVLSAQALYRVQRAGSYPRIDANAGVTIGGGAASGQTTGSSGPGDIYRVYSANVALSAFELDLFGRVRNLSAAALDVYFASKAGAQAARVALVSQLASTYLTLAADSSRLTIARQTLENANASAELARVRLSGGIAAALDLRQAETIMAQAQSSIAEQTTRVAQDLNSLALLVGAPVIGAMVPAALEDVDALVVELPAGVSSQVLLRRPDVNQAEFQLRSANARIGAARAAFFPSISLTGLLGFASGSLGSLFSSDAFGWNVHPNASVNLFNGGADAANVDYASAQRELYLAQYERTIQTAFREVADALARQRTIAEQLAAERAVVQAAEGSYRLAEARYRGGVDNFLATLEAQRTLFAARQSLLQTRLLRAETLVTLYRALGGDSFDMAD
ncbi:MAG TPA: efflux transporter outer membrane subunit [Polyangiaceae bacterium]|nr:efflux transporter outer membrane subunit [Polyangiaceae bacterium]